MSWSEFRQMVSMSLSLDEVCTLCFDLGVDFEELKGESKTSKIRELILLMYRKGKFNTLIAHLNYTCPNILWDEIPLNDDVFRESDRAFVKLTYDLPGDEENRNEVKDAGIVGEFESIIEAHKIFSILINRSAQLTIGLEEEIKSVSLQDSLGNKQKKNLVTARLMKVFREYSIDIDSITTEIADNWRVSYRNLFSLISIEPIEIVEVKANLNNLDKKRQYLDLVQMFETTSFSITKLQRDVGNVRASLVQVRSITKILNRAVTEIDRSITNHEDVLGQISTDLQEGVDMLNRTFELSDEEE